MRVIKAISAAVILILVGVAKADTEPTTMPAIEISNQPLEKVLDQIRAMVPDFRFVVYHEPNCPNPERYPLLPAMKLQGVTIEQFMAMIRNEYPGVQITTIEGNADAPPLYDIKIKAVSATTQPTVVRLFGLDEIIESRKAVAAKNTTDQQVTNDIMSLIQAALEESQSAEDPVLKIHAPTKTLVFKGTAAQADIVSNALAVLNPPEDKVSYEAENIRIKDENHMLSETIKMLRAAATQPSK